MIYYFVVCNYVAFALKDTWKFKVNSSGHQRLLTVTSSQMNKGKKENIQVPLSRDFLLFRNHVSFALNESPRNEKNREDLFPVVARKGLGRASTEHQQSLHAPGIPRVLDDDIVSLTSNT